MHRVKAVHFDVASYEGTLFFILIVMAKSLPLFRAVTVLLVSLLLFTSCGTKKLTEAEKAELIASVERISKSIPFSSEEGERLLSKYEEFLETGDKNTEKEVRELLTDKIVLFASVLGSTERQRNAEKLSMEETLKDLDLYSAPSLRAIANGLPEGSPLYVEPKDRL